MSRVAFLTLAIATGRSSKCKTAVCCDAVLRRMRRRWSSRMFIDRCRLVRESLDNPAITTDIIVGFPGESEADFAATCHVSHECGFSKIHIFPFSPRKGTPAAKMKDI